MNINTQIQALLPCLAACTSTSNRLKLQEKFLKAQCEDTVLIETLKEKILDVADSGKSNAFNNALGFVTYRLGSAKDETTGFFANLRLHIYDSKLKKPEFLEHPHDHAWEFVSFTKFGKIFDTMWSITKNNTKNLYKKFQFIFNRNDKNVKTGNLNFIENVRLKPLSIREVPVGETISVTKGKLHSVEAEQGTVTVILNYGHPSNDTNFMFPEHITPPAKNGLFDFERLSIGDTISGMLSFLIDRLKQAPPSCPIEKP